MKTWYDFSDIPEIEKYKNKPDEYLSPYLVKPIIINASAVTGVRNLTLSSLICATLPNSSMLLMQNSVR